MHEGEKIKHYGRVVEIASCCRQQAWRCIVGLEGREDEALLELRDLMKNFVALPWWWRASNLCPHSGG